MIVITTKLFGLLDKSNNFVNLNYDMNTKRIICTFINMEDASKKSCSIVYGVCGQQEIRTLQENSTSNQISLELDNLEEATYCYVATISNSTFTVNVNGTIDLGKYFNIIIDNIMSFIVSYLFLNQLLLGDSTPQANTGAIVGGVIGGLCFIILIGLYNSCRY